MGREPGGKDTSKVSLIVPPLTEEETEAHRRKAVRRLRAGEQNPARLSSPSGREQNTLWVRSLSYGCP